MAAAAQMELHSQGKPGAALGRPRSEDWQKKNPPSLTLSLTLSVSRWLFFALLPSGMGANLEAPEWPQPPKWSCTARASQGPP